jgi:nicotinamidase-related amidase
MNNPGLLKRDETVFLIVDIQERLMPVINDKEEIFSNVNKLISGAKILDLPLLVTEQYPKGLGHVCKEIKLPDDHMVIEKVCFSCLLSDPIKEKLQRLKARSLVLSGVESHICILKTALDALKNDYEVHIVADAVSSRRKFDKEIALERLKQSGAFIATTEMILFQLLDEAGNEEFKNISRLIK